MNPLSKQHAIHFGYSGDKRRRRRQHRRAVRELLSYGPGELVRQCMRWHLQQARWAGR